MKTHEFMEAFDTYYPCPDREPGARHPYLASDMQAYALTIHQHPSELTRGMQIAVFAVHGPNGADSSVHTIESRPEWPGATYDRFAFNEVVGPSGILVLPERLLRPRIVLEIDRWRLLAIGDQVLSAMSLLQKVYA